MMNKDAFIVAVVNLWTGHNCMDRSAANRVGGPVRIGGCPSDGRH